MPTFAWNSTCQSNQEMVLRANIATSIIYSASSLLIASLFQHKVFGQEKKKGNCSGSPSVAPVSPPPSIIDDCNEKCKLSHCTNALEQSPARNAQVRGCMQFLQWDKLDTQQPCSPIHSHVKKIEQKMYSGHVTVA